MITLSILIPTFNRANKLFRLLRFVASEIANSDIREQVQVLISDNASTDDTCKIISEFSTSHFKFYYFRQEQNQGFDGNLRFLYNQAQTDYVWYLADDDMPLSGSISTIIRAIQDNNPDLLLFSFIQPPGSTVRQFNFSESVHLVRDPIEAIENVLRYNKLSIYVMRKINFYSSQWQTMNENLGSGWYYISLAFSVLEASQNLVLAVISEPLATCDEEYFAISYSPWPLLNMERMVIHPFVMRNNPDLIKYYHRKGYYQAIQFAFAAKVGSLCPEYPEEYDKFIKELEYRILCLLRNPRALIQFIALKLRMASLWPKIKPYVQPLRVRYM